MYERTTLPNGIRIVTGTMPHVRSVSMALFFAVGSRYEPDRIAGVSHFIEHMLFKGTEKYPTAQAISEAIEGVGGVHNAATTKEITFYTAKVASTHLEIALDILIDMVRRPLFDPDEMEKERRVIIEELAMYHDNPQDEVHELIESVLWPGHPLGRDTGGDKSTVEAISRQDLLGYLGRTYIPNSLVVAAAGAVSHEEMVRRITDRLGDWPAANRPAWLPWTPPTDAPRLRVQHRPTEQAHVCIATLGIAHTDPDYYIASLLNGVLGEGMSSRLFLEIREKRGLAYDVHSYVAKSAGYRLPGRLCGRDAEPGCGRRHGHRGRTAPHGGRARGRGRAAQGEGVREGPAAPPHGRYPQRGQLAGRPGSHAGRDQDGGRGCGPDRSHHAGRNPAGGRAIPRARPRARRRGRSIRERRAIRAVAGVVAARSAMSLRDAWKPSSRPARRRVHGGI